MRFIILLCLLFNHLISVAFAFEEEIAWENFSLESTAELIYLQDSINQKASYDSLKNIKFYIISGNLQKAKTHLLKIHSKKKQTLLLKNRYLALIEFIEGNYPKSFNLLKYKEFDDLQNYLKICNLKILSMLFKGDTEKDHEKFHRRLKDESLRCKSLTKKYSPNDQLFMSTLIKFHLGELTFREIKYADGYLSDKETFKIWLKLILFFKKEREVSDQLVNLPTFVYESQELRELVGFVLYRAGDFKKAQEYISDINTANVENIKANLDLNEKNYVGAYNHLINALTRKPNSINALERVTPLSWLTEDYERGLNYVLKLPKENHYDQHKNVILSAFYTKLKKHDESYQKLNELIEKFGLLLPLEGDLLYIQNALALKKKQKLDAVLDHACKKMDGLSCWLMLQNGIWEDLTQLSQRNEEVFAGENRTLLEQLKNENNQRKLSEAPIIIKRILRNLTRVMVYSN